ncbi:MAG: hypothetical protein FJ280_08370 [Planctomycetes bacterium]|nr:hypothetical protein [Planctomycetota bacterium]
MSALAVVVALLSVRALVSNEASPTNVPADSLSVFGYAYGYELTGTPIYDVWEDTLFVSGYPYYPRRRHVPDLPDSAYESWKSSHRDLVQRRRMIARTALREANKASSRQEWIRRYVEVLDGHVGKEVRRYEVSEGGIAVWYEGYPSEVVTYLPTSFPITKRSPPRREEVLQEQEARFRDNQARGMWICWGEGYHLVVPPARQPATTRAIEELRAIARRGHSGAALKEAIAGVDVMNTALQSDQFLHDILVAQRGR